MLVWVCHALAKRPDWAMKSRTALNINEFLLLTCLDLLAGG